MTNLFLEFRKKRFPHRVLNGFNGRRGASFVVTFKGIFTEKEKREVHEHYERLSENLKVYPSVTVQKEGFNNGFGGFYDAEHHHITMHYDHYCASTLAHEMRHAFQHIYYRTEFYLTEFSTAEEYLAAFNERDARKYARDYCEAIGLQEEYRFWQEMERLYEKVIRGEMRPEEVNLDRTYFINHPVEAQIVEDFSEPVAKSQFITFNKVMDYVAILLVIGVVTFYLYDWIGSMEKAESVEAETPAATYILTESQTKLLNEADVEGLTKEQLRIARNEIYARHGMPFGTDDLKRYFEAQPWYAVNPNYHDGLLTELEHKNVYFILQKER